MQGMSADTYATSSLSRPTLAIPARYSPSSIASTAARRPNVHAAGWYGIYVHSHDNRGWLGHHQPINTYNHRKCRLAHPISPEFARSTVPGWEHLPTSDVLPRDRNEGTVRFLFAPPRSGPEYEVAEDLGRRGKPYGHAMDY